jgi:starch synthase
MVSSEVESFARTGGLGDVLTGLSKALADLGCDVVIVTPRYAVTTLPPGARGTWWDQTLRVPVGWSQAEERTPGVMEVPLATRHSAARVCLVDDPLLFDRNGLYGDQFGTFGDNALRFATLSRAALEVGMRVWPDGGPDVVHAHDWHAALAIIYARSRLGPDWARRRAVFSIHNLAFQGVLGFDELDRLGIPRALFHDGTLAHHGSVNLMRGAIALSDAVTTVSETYAHEILEPENGYGLDAFLRAQGEKLLGIVNGIDVESFDPKTDHVLAENYGAKTAAEARPLCKAALLREAGLDPRLDAPLFALVSRLSWQKGIDLFLGILPSIVQRGGRVLFIGQGDRDLEHAVTQATSQYPGRVAARIAFDGDLARRAYGGADFVCVPSRYEPCGLTQLYAMRYGAIPIVTAVGGLRDTVEPASLADGTGTGVVALSCDPVSIHVACEEAFTFYAQRDAMHALVARAMSKDTSWLASARKYLALYEELVAQAR